MKLFLNTSDLNNPTIEITEKWRVWVTKNSKPIIMEVPFTKVKDAHEFIWEQLGKRPASISKL
jgi:hypothetical protein|tara:strand:+ start:705 stop:893 length:189 start_codon:yes stop_codon:yes gene_type:complete